MRAILDTRFWYPKACRRSSSTPGSASCSRSSLVVGAAELLATGIQDFSAYFRDLPSGPVAPDPKDSFLRALAEAGTELLTLKRHKSTRIVTPAAMLVILKRGICTARR